MEDDVSPPKLADSVPNCAKRINLSRAQFYKIWINTGILTPVDLGGRGNVIMLADLFAAVARRAAEQLAAPSLKKPRNSAAHMKANGRCANPIGRNAKPKAAKGKRR